MAFIVFTEAIVKLPFFPPFWAILFFIMLLSLGVGSQIGMLEGMLCTIFDIEILKRISKQYITGKNAFSCINFFHSQNVSNVKIVFLLQPMYISYNVDKDCELLSL